MNRGVYPPRVRKYIIFPETAERLSEPSAGLRVRESSELCCSGRFRGFSYSGGLPWRHILGQCVELSRNRHIPSFIQTYMWSFSYTDTTYTVRNIQIYFYFFTPNIFDQWCQHYEGLNKFYYFERMSCIGIMYQPYSSSAHFTSSPTPSCSISSHTPLTSPSEASPALNHGKPTSPHASPAPQLPEQGMKTENLEKVIYIF